MTQRYFSRRRFLSSSTASLIWLPRSFVRDEIPSQEPSPEALRRQTSVQRPPECYTDDWQRTGPDYVVYLPKEPGKRDEYADHVHVFHTPGGDLMCVWTQGTYESAPDMRVVYSRSKMKESSWSPIGVVDDAKYANMTAALGFPIISRSGGIYCIYNQHLGYGKTSDCLVVPSV